MKSKLSLLVLGLGVVLLTNGLGGGCGQTGQKAVEQTQSDTTPPRAVTNLVAIAGSNNVSLSWEANTDSDLVYYKIYRAEEMIPGSSWTKGDYTFLINITTNEYQDNSVVDGTKYYYKVSAVDTSNNESSVTETNAIPLSYKYLRGWDADIYWGSLSITPYNDLLLGRIAARMEDKDIAYLFNINDGTIKASLEVINSKCLMADDDNNLFSVFSTGVNKYHFQGIILDTLEASNGDSMAPYNGILFGDGVLCASEFDGIYHFSFSTRDITKWASMPDSKFFSLYGIAADVSGNYVYVSDDYNSRILKYDKNGSFILSWGKEGQCPGEFYGPHGLAVDSKGDVYVADDFNYRIQKFDSNGNFITKWGGNGTGDAEFSPTCVAVVTFPH